MTGRRLRVGVAPAAAHRTRARLFAALEAAHPVSFEPREPGALRGLDALIVVGGPVEPADERVPTFVALGEECPGGRARRFELLASPPLTRVLQGAKLEDDCLPDGLATVGVGRVLADSADGPVWTTGADPVARHVVAAFPRELGRTEALRDRLAPRRCMALLPLVHFLREISHGLEWALPPVRAAFVLDDPNLHWTSYGHVRYPQLQAHAREHGYHLAIAMVPLDGWFAHPRAAQLFRDGSDRLSICVHGNDHAGPELGRPRSDAEGAALAAHALRRVERFEQRARVRVSRVMVPPHERVSHAAARGLLAGGFEAICTTRPYPWTAWSPDMPWLTRPASAGPLAAWQPADIVADGLPVLLRAGFEHPRDDLVLRAFLGQPLILYGHQADLKQGLEFLASAADDVNRLGSVRWGSLEAISRGALQTRQDDTVLGVRPFARRVQLVVPDGVDAVQCDPIAVAGDGARWIVRTQGGAARRWDGEPLPVVPGARLELALVSSASPPATTSPGRPRLWPVTRRVAAQGRDRLEARVGARRPTSVRT